MKSAATKLGPLTGSLLVLLSIVGPQTARATPELDRRYALETVGYIRSWDNVDGLFAEYVGAAYKEYFSHQTRFVLQDLSKGDNVLTKAKTPYKKLIEDVEVLGQLARSAHSESLIRTRIQKEGARYRFTLDWLHAPKMDRLATDEFVIDQPPGGKAFGLADLQGSLLASLDRLIKKLPFVGHVTGRDGNSVTINLGVASGIHRGDHVVISTLDEVKQHPLLKMIVDWRMSEVGKIEVEQVDEALSFCRVVEEDPSRKIARYQKVTAVHPAPPLSPKGEGLGGASETETDSDKEPPRLGWISGGPMLGLFTRQDSTASGSTGHEGSGLLLGGKAEGQLWFNPQWFAEAMFGYGFASYSQNDIGQSNSASAGSVTASSWRLALGYSYLISGSFFGPRGWAKLGYQSTSYTMAIDATNQTGPSSFKGVFLGVGGDLPIRANFGAIISLDFGLFISGSRKQFESTTASTATSTGGDGASAVSFFLGGY